MKNTNLINKILTLSLVFVVELFGNCFFFGFEPENPTKKLVKRK